MKNFYYDTICKITHEPQELEIFNCACGFIGMSAAVKYHHCLATVSSSSYAHLFQNVTSYRHIMLKMSIFFYRNMNTSKTMLDCYRVEMIYYQFSIFATLTQFHCITSSISMQCYVVFRKNLLVTNEIVSISLINLIPRGRYKR